MNLTTIGCSALLASVVQWSCAAALGQSEFRLPRPGAQSVKSSDVETTQQDTEAQPPRQGMDAPTSQQSSDMQMKPDATSSPPPTTPAQATDSNRSEQFEAFWCDLGPQPNQVSPDDARIGEEWDRLIDTAHTKFNDCWWKSAIPGTVCVVVTITRDHQVKTQFMPGQTINPLSQAVQKWIDTLATDNQMQLPQDPNRQELVFGCAAISSPKILYMFEKGAGFVPAGLDLPGQDEHLHSNFRYYYPYPKSDRNVFVDVNTMQATANDADTKGPLPALPGIAVEPRQP